MTVPIWKIWELDRIDEPAKKVDKRCLQQNRQRKYKTTSITNKWKVTRSIKSTSRVTEKVNGETYLQDTFDKLEDVVIEKNDTLYSDAFNY